MKPVKVLSLVAVWAVPAMFVIGGSDPVQTQSGPREAPTGFDGESNGFAEEFCANQDALANSPNSPEIPADECNFDAAVEEFTGPETTADGLGPIFNAAGCGECHIANQDPRRHQPDHRRSGPASSTDLFTDHPGGSLIQDRAFDPNEQERVLPGFHQRDRAALHHQRPRRRVRRGGRQHHPAEHRERPAVGAARPAHQRARAGEARDDPHRPLRPQGPAGQPGLVLRGRLPERDGHHQPAAAEREHVQRQRGDRCLRTLPAGIDDEGVDVELFALFMRSTKAPPVDSALARDRRCAGGQAALQRRSAAPCATRRRSSPRLRGP